MFKKKKLSLFLIEHSGPWGYGDSTLGLLSGGMFIFGILLYIGSYGRL